MTTYSIRDLEKLTGIKAHTIRIWEQRYHLITPARTETNVRYYTDENLRLLLNIALLNRNGVKISKLAKMMPEDIRAKGAELTQNISHSIQEIEALTHSMINFDEQAFELLYDRHKQEHGFEATMTGLVFPFLDKLRVMWLTTSVNPAQEKFIGQLIHRKVMSEVDQLPAPELNSDTLKVLLYAPEGEPQELALLFMQYLIRVRQIQGIYLGVGVTLNDLADACQIIRPEFVLGFLQDPLPRQSIQGYLDNAAKCIGASRLLLSGTQLFVSPVMLPVNAQIFKDQEELLSFLEEVQLNRKG